MALKGKAKPQRRICCITCHVTIFWKNLPDHICPLPKLPKLIKIRPKIKIFIPKKMPKGSSHYKYDLTIYKFAHPNGKVFNGTRGEFSQEYKLDKGWISNVLRGVRPSIKGWRLIN